MFCGRPRGTESSVIPRRSRERMAGSTVARCGAARLPRVGHFSERVVKVRSRDRLAKPPSSRSKHSGSLCETRGAPSRGSWSSRTDMRSLSYPQEAGTGSARCVPTPWPDDRRPSGASRSEPRAGHEAALTRKALQMEMVCFRARRPATCWSSLIPRRSRPRMAFLGAGGADRICSSAIHGTAREDPPLSAGS
jgi:hypothetical protein